jgi:hypothetical protein
VYDNSWSQILRSVGISLYSRYFGGIEEDCEMFIDSASLQAELRISIWGANFCAMKMIINGNYYHFRSTVVIIS